jgi:hypothetical protein
MANGRSSQDDRKLESGTPANQANSKPADDGLHPAFYIAFVYLAGTATTRSPLP